MSPLQDAIILYYVYRCIYIEKIMRIRTCMWRRMNQFRVLISYQWASMPIYYGQLIYDIRVILYLYKLMDDKYINN